MRIACLIFTLFVEAITAFGDSVPRDVSVINYASQPVSFHGKAQGGSLTMGVVGGEFLRFISIETKTGQTGDAIADSLFTDFTQTPFFSKYRPAKSLKGDTLIMQSQIIDNAGGYFLAGTEMGLGIPLPPYSLSGSLDLEKNEFHLKWLNITDYDFLSIFASGIFRKNVSGNAEEITYRLGPLVTVPDEGLSFFVIGNRKSTPSNAAAIHLTPCNQDELVSGPFTNGIAPNWLHWQKQNQHRNVIFSQGTKPGLEDYATQCLDDITKGVFANPDAKPYYQILSASGSNATGGVYRRFLGLKPGHKYRVRARMNTLNSPADGSDWSFSLYAVADTAGGGTLTPEQMAGDSPLPDGRSGIDAARIIEYNNTKTTGNQWVEIATGTNAGDVLMPENSDSLTLWFRLKGSSGVSVGFDWIALEDLDCH